MNTLDIVFSSLGGVSVVLNGLIVYFGRLRFEKYKADLEATNKKLSIFIDSSIHISKAQFDKEFLIYQEIWVKLVDLRSKTVSLRPILEFRDPTESDEDRKKKRLKAFGESFCAFIDSMENNKPFFSTSVYEAMHCVYKLCHSEQVEYSVFDPNHKDDYWEQAERNRNEIINGIESCCELIRTRIHSVEVSPHA